MVLQGHFFWFYLRLVKLLANFLCWVCDSRYASNLMNIRHYFTLWRAWNVIRIIYFFHILCYRIKAFSLYVLSFEIQFRADSIKAYEPEQSKEAITCVAVDIYFFLLLSYTNRLVNFTNDTWLHYRNYSMPSNNKQWTANILYLIRLQFYCVYFCVESATSSIVIFFSTHQTPQIPCYQK